MYAMTEHLIKTAADWAPFFRARIAELGLSHLEVDQRAGLADGYTNKIVNGKKLPGAVTIELLCRELEISLCPIANENCALEDCDKPEQLGDTVANHRSVSNAEASTGNDPAGAGLARQVAGASRQGSAAVGQYDPRHPPQRDPNTNRGRGMNDVMERPGIVSMKPPAPTKPTLLAHRRTLELERDALRAGAVELALASAKGDVEARNTLAALPAKLAALQFEIDLSHQAQEMAHEIDAAAQTAWQAAIQRMKPEEIIAGIGKDSCCGRCMPGVGGGCVLTAGAPFPGSVCSHPVKERHLFHRDEHGLRIFHYRDNPQASKVFYAACVKLNVRKEFAQ
jgi:hypothetical protein